LRDPHSLPGDLLRLLTDQRITRIPRQRRIGHGQPSSRRHRANTSAAAETQPAITRRNSKVRSLNAYFLACDAQDLKSGQNSGVTEIPGSADFACVTIVKERPGGLCKTQFEEVQANGSPERG
jgi:hypothetical protein